MGVDEIPAATTACAFGQGVRPGIDPRARRPCLDYTGRHREIAVGAAIGRGILAEEEATPEILEALKGLVELALVWDRVATLVLGSSNRSGLRRPSAKREALDGQRGEHHEQRTGGA